MTGADLDEVEAVLSEPDPARSNRRQRTRLTVQDIDGEPFIEVGYRVHLARRGQGLATEAAMSVREAARR